MRGLFIVKSYLAQGDNPPSKMTLPLDRLADATTATKVVGKIEIRSTSSEENTHARKATGELNVSAKPGFSLQGNTEKLAKTGEEKETIRSGVEMAHVVFGPILNALDEFSACLDDKRVWILLDEWSVVPKDLQPYLADLIRRTIFPAKKYVVKIAAIEHRSNFSIRTEAGNYIGIELGADVAADVNLDDFMVFDNQSERAREFFSEFVFRHFSASEGIPTGIDTPNKLVQNAFTQWNVFDEFVRAAEGVPRDAINILSLAAQRAMNDSIAMIHMRNAAKDWYQRDKENAASANPAARTLLQWIFDQVIGGRKARAFLLRSNLNDPLIEDLFDARVLHFAKKNISSKDEPGVRYDAIKLDFGCYVDLLTTQKAPGGMLPSGSEGEVQTFVEVPPDDFRAIRRAILHLEEFYS